jgi:hypothetical protein
VVGLDLSHLYHRLFVFLGAFRGYNTRFASYKEASATSWKNHNSSLVRNHFYCSLLFSSTMEYLCAPHEG